LYQPKCIIERQKLEKKMSLYPWPVFEVPEETVRIAQAAFPKGNIYLRMRDKIGVVFTDKQFETLFSERGQPAFSPWRLALISIMQFVEDLSDRQAAEAVRSRIDWKYLLGLELEDAGFDYSILSEFRQRLVTGGMEDALLDTMLKELGEQKLLKGKGKQRTDSTHVVAAVRKLNRMETIGETMRATLNILATVAPDWLREVAPIEWFDRYESRMEEYSLPHQKKKRAEWVRAVGADGIYLLTSIYQSPSHHWLWSIPAVESLRLVWLHQFYYVEGQLQLRQVKDLPPASIRLDSPYDPQAHYSRKRETEWVGYKVHITESCDSDHPHLITHVHTTLATQPDADMTEPIHQALAKKNCLPHSHLVDMGYVDAEQIVTSQEEYGVTLIGPVRPDTSWQTKEKAGYACSDFEINWQAETATCPRGISSDRWENKVDSWGNEVIQVRFPRQACHSCTTRSLCTRSVREPRLLTLRPQAHYEALQNARQTQQTQTWRQQYDQRAGIEGTISQAVRGFGLRQCRYIGLAKTHLQHVLTAAAINLARLDNWVTGKKRAQVRLSRFAALRPVPV
jgi:transposase